MLGVTGSFGSGCTTLAHALDAHGFKRVSISASIREEFQAQKRKGRTTTTQPERKLLQDFGNQQRKDKGPEYWARRAVQAADKLSGVKSVVFDGIRNVCEIEYLRREFPNFYLITVWCPQKTRWDRVKDEYGGNSAQFEEDDKRDSDEELEYGQQVQICVDKADIVIRNDQVSPSPAAAKRHLGNVVREYISLLAGTGETRPPTNHEMAMAIAYTSSLRSLCLKRTVGAAIATHQGVLVSAGFNENPLSMKPCIHEYTYCFKDLKLRDHILSTIKRWPSCPSCKNKLNGAPSLKENTKCGKCGYNLSRSYAPDRGMSRCTAVHAEMAAILNASSRDLTDKTLYTTTFPCSQCARQIAYVGLKKVVYVEPYPDPDSESFLRESCHISVEMFEGVKARAYERIFGNIREGNERKYPLPI